MFRCFVIVRPADPFDTVIVPVTEEAFGSFLFDSAALTDLRLDALLDVSPDFFSVRSVATGSNIGYFILEQGEPFPEYIWQNVYIPSSISRFQSLDERGEIL